MYSDSKFVYLLEVGFKVTDDHVKHEVRSSSKHTLPHSVIVADVITFGGFSSSMICSLPALFSLFWRAPWNNNEVHSDFEKQSPAVNILSDGPESFLKNKHVCWIEKWRFNY